MTRISYECKIGVQGHVGEFLKVSFETRAPQDEALVSVP